jgi:hypothetical protein
VVSGSFEVDVCDALRKISALVQPNEVGGLPVAGEASDVSELRKYVTRRETVILDGEFAVDVKPLPVIAVHTYDVRS